MGKNNNNWSFEKTLNMKIFQQFLTDTFELPHDQIDLFCDKVREKTLAKNDFLLQKGDTSQYIYFVERGVLRMYAIADNGKEHIIQFAPENWLLSDRRSTYLNEPTRFFIQAIEDSEVVLIGKDAMTKMITSFPQTAAQNTMLLHLQIMRMQHRVEMLLSANVLERYVDFTQFYPNFSQRVPQWMIASFLGTTPESLSRAKQDYATRK
jgi:CRP-like cAMP-binding protein